MTSIKITSMASGTLQWEGEYQSVEDAMSAFADAAGVEWPAGSYITSFPGTACPQDPDGWPAEYVIERSDLPPGTMHFAFVAPSSSAL